MLSAVMDANDKGNLQKCIGYVNNLCEIYAYKNIRQIILDISNSLNVKVRRTADISLSFACDKSEVIYFSLATHKKSKYPEYLILTNTMPAYDIFSSNQIKLLDIIVDNTPNFIVHDLHASSKGMQALESLC
jgi:hypothetical protein